MGYYGWLFCKSVEALVHSAVLQVLQRSFCDEQFESVHVTSIRVGEYATLLSAW
jgi:hypothetical protein